jgi:hypothetical protein
MTGRQLRLRRNISSAAWRTLSRSSTVSGSRTMISRTTRAPPLPATSTSVWETSPTSAPAPSSTGRCRILCVAITRRTSSTVDSGMDDHKALPWGHDIADVQHVLGPPWDVNPILRAAAMQLLDMYHRWRRPSFRPSTRSAACLELLRVMNSRGARRQRFSCVWRSPRRTACRYSLIAASRERSLNVSSSSSVWGH